MAERAAIPAAIYTTDAQGKITYYNEAAVELAGRRPTIGSDEWCVTWKLYRPDGTPLPHDQSPLATALKEGRPIRNADVVGAINLLADISERRQAENQHRVLLSELNHRVKNNMQMLQSLLFAAARRTQDAEAKKVLVDACSRIATMGAAQRVLYGTSDATRFSAAEFLNAVCETVRQSLPANVTVACDAGSGEISNDAAMPLALILNELLTNAAKHGLNGRQESTIRVGLIWS